MLFRCVAARASEAPGWKSPPPAWAVGRPTGCRPRRSGASVQQVDVVDDVLG